jgi:hypothetical protein
LEINTPHEMIDKIKTSPAKHVPLVESQIELLPLSFQSDIVTKSPTIPPIPFTNYARLQNPGKQYYFAFVSVIRANSFVAAIQLLDFERTQLSTYFSLILLSLYRETWTLCGILPFQTRHFKGSVDFTMDARVLFQGNGQWRDLLVRVTSSRLSAADKKKKSGGSHVVGAEEMRGQVLFVQRDKEGKEKILWYVSVAEAVYAVWPQKSQVVERGLSVLAKIEGSILPFVEDDKKEKREIDRKEMKESDKKEGEKKEGEKKDGDKREKKGGRSEVPLYALVMLKSTPEMLQFIVSCMAAFNLDSNLKKREKQIDDGDIAFDRSFLVDAADSLNGDTVSEKTKSGTHLDSCIY